MRTIIAGSRDLTDMSLVEKAITMAPWEPTLVVSGGAKGVDALAEQWAEANGIQIERHVANWKKFGRAAGPIRNQTMAENAEALIAVWDGKSKGTGNMIALARKAALCVYVHQIP